MTTKLAQLKLYKQDHGHVWSKKPRRGAYPCRKCGVVTKLVPDMRKYQTFRSTRVCIDRQAMMFPTPASILPCGWVSEAGWTVFVQSKVRPRRRP
jgi:hypothetical protein